MSSRGSFSFNSNKQPHLSQLFSNMQETINNTKASKKLTKGMISLMRFCNQSKSKNPNNQVNSRKIMKIH